MLDMLDSTRPDKTGSSSQYLVDFFTLVVEFQF